MVLSSKNFGEQASEILIYKEVHDMKIYGNRNTLWIEISKEEFGEDVKLECKGEMLVGGFWIYGSEDIKQLLPIERILTDTEKEDILKFVLENNDNDKFKIEL